MSPLQCQKRLRLTEARRLMLDENKNVTEASFEAVSYTHLQQINDSYYTLEDAAQQIRSYAQDIVANPSRLEEVNQRLAVIKDTCRKYGGSIEAALAQAEEYRLQLDQVENKDYYGRELAKELAIATKEFSTKSAILHQLRQQAAATLGDAITQHTQLL